jgi:hypothetical protein
MEYRLVLGGLVSAAPILAVWIAALVLSSVLMRRGGSKLERLLIIGSSLMLVSTLLGTPKQAIANYLIRNGSSAIDAAAVISYINILLGLISLAGIICLFYATWKRFREKQKGTADYQ